MIANNNSSSPNIPDPTALVTTSFVKSSNYLGVGNARHRTNNEVGDGFFRYSLSLGASRITCAGIPLADRKSQRPRSYSTGNNTRGSKVHWPQNCPDPTAPVRTSLILRYRSQKPWFQKRYPATPVPKHSTRMIPRTDGHSRNDSTGHQSHWLSSTISPGGRYVAFFLRLS